MQQENRLAFSFTGTGGEYFRIWIVNVFLTIITLGIFSAWAKVRRNQYFYRNTWLEDASFDYHGNPVAILKGRILALVLLFAYNYSPKVSFTLFFIVLALIAIIMPVLLVKSFRFRALNTSYRGLRFGFSANLKEAYKTFLALPILTILTLYILAPFTHQRIKKFQHEHSKFGTTPFQFDAPVKSFYKIYGAVILMYIAAVLGLGLLMVPLFAAGMGHGNAKAIALGTTLAFVFILAAILFIGPYMVSRFQNLVWNHTTLGAQSVASSSTAFTDDQVQKPHRFESTVQARKLLAIFITNFICIIFTFGLFKPFADIRLARYRLSQMTLIANGSLQDFISEQQDNVGAFGQEAAELFDLDIAL